MENRKKFYSNGLWGKDTLQERYEHVMGVLDAYHRHLLDEQDLLFVIKNAFVSKVYVSEGVVKAYPAPQPLFGNLSGLYVLLLKHHVLDLQDAPHCLHTEYMEICELGTKVSYQKGKGKIAKDKPSIRVEHVVPADVFMDDVKKIATFDDFKRIFDAVSICLVTDAEARLLDSKGLRSKMPAGCVYTQKPFGRYDKAGVKVY
jgi:hypothetical protein